MVIESDKKKNNLISVIGLVIGLIFLFLTAKIENPNQNQKAAYLLGLLISSLAGISLVNQDKRKTEIQAEKKRVVFTRKSFFGGEEIRVIPFDLVKWVGVTGVGRRDVASTRTYFIYITLKEGKTIRTGYSSFDEYGTKELAAEIARTIGCDHSATPIPPLDSEVIENVILAGFIAALAWAIVYRIKIGPWSQAMWFGTSAGIFMLSSAISFYYILMIIRRKYEKNSNENFNR